MVNFYIIVQLKVGSELIGSDDEDVYLRNDSNITGNNNL